jgi:group I intron endonuclease
MYGIIYKATGPAGKVYVGQTTKSLFMRKKQHLFRAKFGDRRTAFQLALLDEGAENFTWEQIDAAESREDLDYAEKHWITYYKSDDPAHGYNSTDGGLHYSPNVETRRKISKINKGRKRTEEMKKRNREWHLGRHHTLETRRKISEAGKGRRHSIESRQKMSEAAKNISLEHRRKLSEAGRGEKNSCAKLTEAEVRQIKVALANGENCTLLGKKYGVIRQAISNIKRGKTWAQLTIDNSRFMI